jgi:hypothetical protein
MRLPKRLLATRKTDAETGTSLICKCTDASDQKKVGAENRTRPTPGDKRKDLEKKANGIKRKATKEL